MKQNLKGILFYAVFIIATVGIILFVMNSMEGESLVTSDLVEMVRNGGTAHAHQTGQIDDTFLTVAQNPEYADPAAIAQLLKEIGYRLKVLRAGRMGQFLLDLLLAVIVRQNGVEHGKTPFHIAWKI